MWGGVCVCRIFMIWEEIFIIWSTKLSSRSKVMLSGSHSRLVVEPGGHLDFLTPRYYWERPCGQWSLQKVQVTVACVTVAFELLLNQFNFFFCSLNLFALVLRLVHYICSLFTQRFQYIYFKNNIWLELTCTVNVK